MEIEILKLLYDYSVNKKLVDNKFIEELICIVVKHKDMNEYVRLASFVTSGMDLSNIFAQPLQTAFYNPLGKQIIVYTDVMRELMECGDGNAYMFNGNELYFYRNLLVVQIVLHELDHAHQLKIVEQDANDMETKILKYSYDEVIKSRELLEHGYSLKESAKNGWINYDIFLNRKKLENYILLPDERLAQFNSYNQVISILNYIKDYVPKVLKYQEYCKLNNLLVGYDSIEDYVKSPTISYVKVIGEEQSLGQFDWYDSNSNICLDKVKQNYSLFDRLKFGLPIDTLEYDSVCNSLPSLKKIK